MDFILTNISLDNKYMSKSIGQNFIYFEKNNLNTVREIIIETDDFFVLGDANLSFINAVNKNLSINNIEENINQLKNGFIVFFDKHKNEAFIYTDVFGFNHLFYIKEDNFFGISSDFKSLLKFSKHIPDKYAIMDILLFNYTLFDRTIISDVKRLSGGTKVSVINNHFQTSFPFNFANRFQKKSYKSSLNSKQFSEGLRKGLAEDLSVNNETNLSITGGFDSRAMLALCKNMQIDISTFTFGQEGSIEQEIVKTFIHDHIKKHTFYKLDNHYIKNLPKTLVSFINSNLDNPVILDLPQYQHIKENIEPSNIIAGFMGGELMTGQSIGSQVTFTKAAAILLMSKTLEEAEQHFRQVLNKLDFIDPAFSNQILTDYIITLKPYLAEKNKTNILRFLLNESYSKFFGAVNKTFKNHSNLIVPFINDSFINYILNTSISFLYKTPFVKNPFANFRSKVFYAKSIKHLYPALAETRFDRLYKVNDLCIKHRILIAAFGYIQSHLFKKNKKEYPRPHHYDLWYKDIITEQLSDKEYNKSIGIYNEKFKLNSTYSQLPSIQKKNLAEIAAINIAINLISRNSH